ncbi:thymidylate kinase-domain-containing protein [Chytriomyces cf. hyalinus JEL632]|nr:thymidylate kinase-domain-containing protein [Chytriomyces cf. hyalinus JEL632]
MRFPDTSTPTGKLIDAYLSNTSSNDALDDRTIHRLFATNRSEVMQNLRKTLWSGTSDVLDRYTYSGVAYSQAKGLEQEWCMGVDAGCIQPDVVFFLDPTPKDAAMCLSFSSEADKPTPPCCTLAAVHFFANLFKYISGQVLKEHLFCCCFLDKLKTC